MSSSSSGSRVLLLALVHALDLQLRDAVHQVRDFRAELTLHLLRRDVAVLDDVVQQAGGQRLLVHLQIGEDLGDFDGMDDVGLAVVARSCAAVLLVGELEGAAHEVGVGLRAMGQQTLCDALHCGAEGFLKRAGGLLGSLFGGRPFRRGTNGKLCHGGAAPLQHSK